MKLSHARIVLVVLVVVLTTSGCSIVNRIRAKHELNEAARSYKEGKFVQAQHHSQRALDLDPAQQTAPVFVARSIHAQYKRGVSNPENIGKAKAAIAAYQRILSVDPNNDEAYQAVAALYGNIGESDAQRQWITTRATNSSVSNEKRSEAYTFLASKEWDCSYQITERKDNQGLVTNKDGKTVIVYKMPKERKDYDTALNCVTQGMKEVETALNLDPNNEKAWGYKANLFRELSNLSEMDGKPDKKAEYAKQFDEASKRTRELSDQKRARKEAEAKKSSAQPATE